MNKKLVVLVLALSAIMSARAEQKLIQYGNFENWVTRHIKESSIIGGKTKTLYAIGPAKTIDKNAPFSCFPWGISNAYAKVMGIEKGSCSAYPEARPTGGHCARLDVKLEEVKVLGMINISVVVGGSIFLGKTHEPIKSANSPYSNIEMGIPFTQRPKALVFDYKCKVSDEQTYTKATGTSGVKTIQGHDCPEVFVFLQKRWEDADGNIHCLRIATAREQYTHTVANWQNGHRLELHYGDLTKQPGYKSYYALNCIPYNAMNSKGKMVQMHEDGWAPANTQPTHVIMMITSASHRAFNGHIGNTLWVDNVKWEY